MRAVVLLVLAACGGPAAVPPSPVLASPMSPSPVSPSPVSVVTYPARTVLAGVPHSALRGERCTKDSCADGLTCLDLPGGYCASACGSACDGACVETGTLGEVCLAACTTDADCRTREGYTCDPAWHACSLPNLTAIVPRQCPESPAPRGAHDPSFAPAEAIAIGRDPDAAGDTVLFTAGDTVRFASGALVASRSSAGATLLGDGDAPAIAEVRGHLVAAWRTHGGISLATSTDRGATWSAPRALGDDCGDCSAPPLLASNGAILYALDGSEAVGLRARASRDGGATFGSPVAVSRGSAGGAAVDRAGGLHVVALVGGVHGAYGSAMQRIEYTSPAGAAHAVSLPDEKLPTFFAAPAIAVDDAHHRIWIAYVRGGRDATWDLVIAASRDGGATWTRTALGDGCALHAVPTLAVDPTTGLLHATFYDTNAMPGRYAHATCALAASPSCIIRGALSGPPGPRFATFDLGRGGPHSLGERAALTITGRALDAYWTQPLADGIHVMHARAKL